MEIETIQVDSAFPKYQNNRLKEYLQNGWKIIDKTVTDDRYISYVLQKD